MRPMCNSRSIRAWCAVWITTAAPRSSGRPRMLGSQSAVAAGGRYDGLVEQLGGPPIPGVGFAMGVERLTMLLRLQESAARRRSICYVVWIGDKARDWAFPVVHRLRRQGLSRRDGRRVAQLKEPDAPRRQAQGGFSADRRRRRIGKGQRGAARYGEQTAARKFSLDNHRSGIDGEEGKLMAERVFNDPLGDWKRSCYCGEPRRGVGGQRIDSWSVGCIAGAIMAG